MGHAGFISSTVSRAIIAHTFRSTVASSVKERDSQREDMSMARNGSSNSSVGHDAPALMLSFMALFGSNKGAIQYTGQLGTSLEPRQGMVRQPCQPVTPTL